jgi:hypothetical protein
VPIARALRLSAIVAYLAARVVIAPFGLAIVRTPRNLFAAIAAVTMPLGPPVATLTDTVLQRFAMRHAREADDFEGVHSSVLMIGFGRFGQVASQCLLAEGVDVTAIDKQR